MSGSCPAPMNQALKQERNILCALRFKCIFLFFTGRLKGRTKKIKILGKLPTEMQGKSLLLKTPHTLVAKIQRNQAGTYLETSLILAIICSAKGAVQAAVGEKVSMISSRCKPYELNTNLRHTHLCNSDLTIMKVTNCSLIRFEALTSGGDSCLIRQTCSNTKGHRGKPAAVLLNGHDVKSSSKYLHLYSSLVWVRMAMIP